MRQSQGDLNAFLVSEHFLQLAKWCVIGKQRSEKVLAHKDQEQRCSRATLSQKSNSSTLNTQSQRVFFDLVFEV